MNKKILAFRLTLAVAAGIAITAFIYANDPRLLSATFPGTSEEIILTASSMVLPDDKPQHVIATEKAITWELRYAPAQEDATFVFISAKAQDPIRDAKVVTWSYERDHHYGCLELYPSLEGYKNNPRLEILAGICLPMSVEQSVFSMDKETMMTALNFTANSYISLVNHKQASQGRYEAQTVTMMKGVERLENARALILARANEHIRRLCILSGLVGVILVITIIANMESLYRLSAGPWNRRLAMAVINYAAGVPMDKHKLQAHREAEARQKKEAGLATARELLREASESAERRRERDAQGRREQEARDLFLAGAEKFGPNVAREAAKLYDNDDREGARAIIWLAEERKRREYLLEALENRVHEEILDQIKRSQALDSIRQAREMLNAKPRDWRKHLHPVETLLANGNGSRRPNRPR